MASIVEGLGGQVSGVAIVDMVDNTFIATVYVEQDDGKHSFDARPSDAICLALLAKAPILASDEIIANFGVTIEYDPEPVAGAPEAGDSKLLTEFHDFLEQVRPDDFRGHDGELPGGPAA